jgi:hypothetical protein
MIKSISESLIKNIYQSKSIQIFIYPLLSYLSTNLEMFRHFHKLLILVRDLLRVLTSEEVARLGMKKHF